MNSYAKSNLRAMIPLALLLGLFLSCQDSTEPDSKEMKEYNSFTSKIADVVVDYHPGSFVNETYTDPNLAVNGIHGGGASMGSTDVVSLGANSENLVCGEGDLGGYIILRIQGKKIVNQEGPDFKVFENPFLIGSDESTRLIEVGVVAVSNDLETWVEFPHTLSECSQGMHPNNYLGFAGVNPVYIHETENPMDYMDTNAGGDTFDLDTIQVDSCIYIRITDGGSLYHENTGFPPGDFDLDGIASNHIANDSTQTK